MEFLRLFRSLFSRRRVPKSGPVAEVIPITSPAPQSTVPSVATLSSNGTTVQKGVPHFNPGDRVLMRLGKKEYPGVVRNHNTYQNGLYSVRRTRRHNRKRVFTVRVGNLRPRH